MTVVFTAPCPDCGGDATWQAAGTPSLNVNNDQWHGWLTNGELTP